jgi:predicted RNase H-like nuclease (RuvC/YqgF family)
MSTRFPVIESKKTLMEEEDYNFVNKGQKKKVGSGNPLELIEELKRKIEEQKKEIDNRNITIQGLQRNFESLSVIVKTEKTQSAMLRAELENLKLNAETGDRRAM